VEFHFWQSVKGGVSHRKQVQEERPRMQPRAT